MINQNNEFLLQKLETYVSLNKGSGIPFEAKGETWENCRKTITSLINSDGIKNVEEQTYNKYFSANSPEHQVYNVYADLMQSKLSYKSLKIMDMKNHLIYFIIT